jgi:hypothetical protein
MRNWRTPRSFASLLVCLASEVIRFFFHSLMPLRLSLTRYILFQDGCEKLEKSVQQSNEAYAEQSGHKDAHRNNQDFASPNPRHDG